MSNGDNLTTSALGRMFKLGSMATRVGFSLATEHALGFMFSDPIQQARKTEKFVLNAMRVTEALGELKGAAMKAGQMLSLHEGLLPPEAAVVLRGLQQAAPKVSFDTMQRRLRTELPNFDELFESLDPEPIAAASIGQVYRARLRDGREVAVKVQYPEIDRVVRSDLKNLKKLFSSLVAMVAEVDFDDIWEEVRDRLLEELDYTHEARNTERMVALHAGVSEIVVPGVITEASTQRVLTMEYIAGISPDDACAGPYSEALRDTWGINLLKLTLRGLTEHRFLHADPNLGNFAFLADGGLVVYDHGCVKSVDEPLAEGYRRLLHALIEKRGADVPNLLAEMGVRKKHDDAALAPALIEPMLDMVEEIFGPEPYRFTSEAEIYGTAFDLQANNINEWRDVNLPPDMVFVNRTLGGLFGNLCRLKARARWAEVALPFVAGDHPSERSI